MSARAAAYQDQITGRAGSAGRQVYHVNGTNFDGYDEAGGVLRMPRGEFGKGIGRIINKPWFAHNFQKWVSEARTWVANARGTPIEYHVAAAELRDKLAQLYEEHGVAGIKVIRTALKG